MAIFGAEDSKLLDLMVSDHFIRDSSSEENMVSKANTSLEFLRRNLKIGAVNIKELRYNSLVRPVLGYASTVCCPTTQRDITRLEAVQK